MVRSGSPMSSTTSPRVMPGATRRIIASLTRGERAPRKDTVTVATLPAAASADAGEEKNSADDARATAVAAATAQTDLVADMVTPFVGAAPADSGACAFR